MANNASKKKQNVKRKQKRSERRATRRRIVIKERRVRAKADVVSMDRVKDDILSNRTSELETSEEEKEQRQTIIEEQIKIFREMLPSLLKAFARIEDPRNPKKLKHKSTSLLLYGILIFVFQMSSRREANREMTMPTFVENLQQAFPELETIPHADSLKRFLSDIEVEQILDSYIGLIEELIRNKKFARYLNSGRYQIAIDGTQKLSTDADLIEEALRRTREKENDDGTTEEREQYYVYVLESCLVFSNGIRIPLLSEFLTMSDGNIEQDKQDCELKAFKRLAKRLKSYFPCLRIMLLLDGLYPNGPVFEICRQNKWDFMIVLKDKSLPSVWDEYKGLLKLHPENEHVQFWGNRKQLFRWVNSIDYYYGPREQKKQILHVVVCEEEWEEQWEEIDRTSGEVVRQGTELKKSRHAWISDQPLTKDNLHSRCNLAARYRWGIETNILVEKHQGYHYEHLFSTDFQAMKGFHYLMHIAHTLNVIAQFSERSVELVKQRGIRPFLRFVRETFAGPWLDFDRIQAIVSRKHQIRLM